jgi:hypothetical protein
LAEAPADRRLCPTRANGAHSLIAHWITPATCLERQRRSYHKCFTCQYQGLSASAVLPALPKASPAPKAAEPEGTDQAKESPRKRGRVPESA